MDTTTTGAGPRPGTRSQGGSGVPGARGTVALGALLGVTWAAGLRGWMLQLAGPESSVTWPGTFGALLLPAAVVGALLGWAEHLRRTGGRRYWRWLGLAPLLLPVVALSLPGAVSTLLSTGMGGGAIGIAILGIVGGKALSGRGRSGVRLLCAVAALWLIPAAFLGPPMRPELDPRTPLGAWAATSFSTLFLVLCLACAIPQRGVVLSAHVPVHIPTDEQD